MFLMHVSDLSGHSCPPAMAEVRSVSYSLALHFSPATTQGSGTVPKTFQSDSHDHPHELEGCGPVSSLVTALQDREGMEAFGAFSHRILVNAAPS